MFTHDAAEFLHKVVDHLPVHDRTKKDLHTELAVNTQAPADKEGNTDAPE